MDTNKTEQENKPEIPDWWENYKKYNSDDKDEYDPKHCCARFWKDFCDCVKSYRR